MGFDAAATTTGLLIGAICGLVPLLIGIRYRIIAPTFWAFLACIIGGFSAGLFGGIIMLICASSVVVSYSYIDREDPFTSRASLEEIDFEESPLDTLLRQMSSFGRFLRMAIRALIRNKAGFLGFMGICFFFAMSVFGPSFIEYDGDAHYRDRAIPGRFSLFRSPSCDIDLLRDDIIQDCEFPLGLDYQGRDILSHIVYGGRTLISIAIQAGVITTIIAVSLGAMAGLIGGFVDQALSALSNFILTIPQFPLLLVIASTGVIDEMVTWVEETNEDLPINLPVSDQFFLAMLFALLGWPVLMRAIRAQVLSLRERDYIQAAIALDLGLFHIITREVLPNIISYIVVNMIFAIRGAMYGIVGLVFLGIIPLEEPDWGVMIYVGRSQGALTLVDAASMVLSPIVAIALFQLSLVLFTRSLEEIFNPRLRSGL